MALTHRSVTLAALGIILVAVRPVASTVALWAVILAILIALDVMLAPKPATLSFVRSTDPTTVRLGASAVTSLAVYNGGSRTARIQLRDVWQPTARIQPESGRLTIPPQERRRFTAELMPVRRGKRRSQQVAIRVSGPLGLAYRTGTRTVEGSLLVLPPFHARQHLPSRLARLREMDGQSSVNIRGQGTEFDSLREYVIGDDVRAIDWRATARAQDVMVRTWRPERDRRVVVIIDTGRLSAVRLGNEIRLDASIEATLLLAALAGHAGDRIDVLAVDTAVRAHVRSSSVTTLMHELAVGLADVEPNLGETDWHLAASLVRRTVSQRSLVVIATALDSSVISGSMRTAVAALAAQHTVVVAGAYDTELNDLTQRREDLAEIYTAAAAEHSLLSARDALAALARTGAFVVQSSADALPPDLADMYLQLKATGKL